MVNENFEFLAFGIVKCARQKVTLLSEELLYTQIAGLTLSSFRLLCTLDNMYSSVHPYSEFDTLFPSFIMYS